jgi:hypothetical protein
MIIIAITIFLLECATLNFGVDLTFSPVENDLDSQQYFSFIDATSCSPFLTETFQGNRSTSSFFVT